MIWFACKKCSKVHGRPDNSAGAMVFCDCGQSMTVPWESTAKEPPMPPPIDLPLAPTLEPVTFPTTSSSSSGQSASYDRPYNREGDYDRPLRPRRRRKHVVDPNICFNHERTASKGVCRDCGLGFCEQCLIEFEGHTLCGPCKNFRIRLEQQPQEWNGLAVLAVAGSLLSVTIYFCLGALGSNSQMPYLPLVALLPEIAACLAAVVVLSRLQRSGKTAGRAVAFAAIAAAVSLSLVMGIVTIFGSRLAMG